MKKILFFFLLAPLFTTAQDKALLAVGVSPGLYVNHKVAAKENYYSIGRIYNISPKDIAPFNNLQLESGLIPGYVLKIPLNSSNFFQSGNAAADETFVPVYYEVKDKEGLYRVAVNHNDLPVETLKQWNNIKGESVKKGTKLIVGYLKVKTELSGLAKNGIGTVINSNTNVTVKAEEKKTAEPDKKTTAKTNEPVPDKPVKEDEKKETVKPPAKEPIAAKSEKPVGTVKNTVTGNFKNIYESQIKNAETQETGGMAGIFKSTSGWQDKKYYCLYNNATAGTIIKITNPVNGKFVFAKVLDLMPDIKQNGGLLLIISNAAAQELEAGESNFNCSIKYAK
jgi:LysM repeat protein